MSSKYVKKFRDLCITLDGVVMYDESYWNEMGSDSYIILSMFTFLVADIFSGWLLFVATTMRARVTKTQWGTNNASRKILGAIRECYAHRS